MPAKKGKENNCFINRIGERWLTNEGYWVLIIECFGIYNCTIQFDSGVIFTNRRYSEITSGSVKNPYHKSVFGIGYLGIGKAVVSKNSVLTLVYKKWFAMLQRCYSLKTQQKQMSYIGCLVDESWHNFQVFAEWYEKRYNPEFMQGWALDKDILLKNNKIYSSETCCLVPREINNIFTKREQKRGIYPLGVHKKGSRYIAQLNKKGINTYLGSFNTPKEAFEVYKYEKEKYAKELAEEYRGQITEECYWALMSYIVEITD